MEVRNKPDAVNPARALRFANEDHWRRVTDLGRFGVMNRWVAFVLGCVIGGAVASALWKWHLTRSQIDLVVMHVSDRAWQADLGQQILSYMDNPDTAKATRLEMVASNLVVTFPEDVALFDQEYRPGA